MSKRRRTEKLWARWAGTEFGRMFLGTDRNHESPRGDTWPMADAHVEEDGPADVPMPTFWVVVKNPAGEMVRAGLAVDIALMRRKIVTARDALSTKPVYGINYVADQDLFIVDFEYGWSIKTDVELK
jgi:hypothetical protein